MDVEQQIGFEAFNGESKKNPKRAPPSKSDPQSPKKLMRPAQSFNRVSKINVFIIYTPFSPHTPSLPRVFFLSAPHIPLGPDNGNPSAGGLSGKKKTPVTSHASRY